MRSRAAMVLSTLLIAALTAVAAPADPVPQAHSSKTCRPVETAPICTAAASATPSGAVQASIEANGIALTMAARTGGEATGGLTTVFDLPEDAQWVQFRIPVLIQSAVARAGATLHDALQPQPGGGAPSASAIEVVVSTHHSCECFEFVGTLHDIVAYANANGDPRVEVANSQRVITTGYGPVSNGTVPAGQISVTVDVVASVNIYCAWTYPVSQCLPRDLGSGSAATSAVIQAVEVEVMQ